MAASPLKVSPHAHAHSRIFHISQSLSRKNRVVRLTGTRTRIHAATNDEASLVAAALETQNESAVDDELLLSSSTPTTPIGVNPGMGADETNIPQFFAVQLKAGKFVIDPPRTYASAADVAQNAEALGEFAVVGKTKAGAPCCTTPLQLKDTEECADLLMAVFFKKKFGVDNKQMFKDQRERVLEGLRLGVESSAQSGRLLMVLRLGERGGGEVAAMAEVSLPGANRFGAEKLRPETPPNEAYLADVAVNKTFRRQGLGKAILKAAEEVTESFGCNKLYMHVRADNPEALGLFEGQGYFEPADAKASLTSEDITKRTNGLLTKIGIAESGHYLLMRNLSTEAAI